MVIDTQDLSLPLSIKSLQNYMFIQDLRLKTFVSTGKKTRSCVEKVEAKGWKRETNRRIQDFLPCG
jgi:hypothetical protein